LGPLKALEQGLRQPWDYLHGCREPRLVGATCCLQPDQLLFRRRPSGDTAARPVVPLAPWLLRQSHCWALGAETAGL